MNIKTLKEIGLTDRQIELVVAEYNRNTGIRNEALERQQKRADILAIEDAAIRQQLIKENKELF